MNRFDKLTFGPELEIQQMGNIQQLESEFSPYFSKQELVCRPYKQDFFSSRNNEGHSEYIKGSVFE